MQEKRHGWCRSISIISVPKPCEVSLDEDAAHPLLQQVERLGIGSRGIEYMMVFHEKLMSLYIGHCIDGQCLFPGAGFLEMGLAAGARMLQGSIGGGIELLDVSFVSPLDIEDGCKLISRHTFGRGMKTQ